MVDGQYVACATVDDMGNVAVATGTRVRATRLATGLTQEQLAVAAGLTSRTVKRVEAGEETTLGTLVAIAGALAVSVVDLVDDPQRAAS